eukprot:Lankesteria_metandrocarpae@DN2041_c0_g1_i1.p2
MDDDTGDVPQLNESASSIGANKIRSKSVPGEDFDFEAMDAEENKDVKMSTKSGTTNKQPLSGITGRRVGTAVDLETLRARAECESRQYIDEANSQDNSEVANDHSNIGNAAVNNFRKEFNLVVQEADVILKVLDARDPNGCRSKKAESYVLSEGKHLVFILTKIDLVPKDVAREWLTYLRRYAPTVPFKSLIGHKGSTRAKLSNDNPLTASDSQLQSNTQVLGVTQLLDVLKNYSRVSGTKGGSKMALTVGLVGYPNVGKSSIINSLRRDSRAVSVGAEAGLTRSLQRVQIDKKLLLIDSPGVVFEAESGTAASAAVALRNATKVSNITDPVTVTTAILAKVAPDVLLRHFRIPMFSSPNEFITHVARVRGKYLRGGAPDVDNAARHVITEWQTGKIPHFCKAPTAGDDDGFSAEDYSENKESAIVSSLSAPFVIDSEDV